MMICAITNPLSMLMIVLAECSQVGLRRDSSSAGRRFAPYMTHKILQLIANCLP
jgi:hypothetical protein